MTQDFFELIISKLKDPTEKGSTMAPIDKIKEMFLLQRQLNIQTAGPNWNTREDVIFENAIIAESGELLESLGYKWWKKPNIDLANAKVEVVDLWHFAMSLLMQHHGVDDETIDGLVNICEYPLIAVTDYFDSQSMLQRDIMEFVHVATVVREDVYESDLLMFKYGALMGDVGLNLDALYTMYIIKNALNKFRQDNGYATGTYQKIWNGREDNEVAMEQCQGLTYDETLVKLGEIYSNL